MTQILDRIGLGAEGISPADEVTTAPLVALGLAGGFVLARETGVRSLGGLFFAGVGAFAARSWLAKTGPLPTALLSAGYVAAMGLSHPLAKKVGPWPSVALVSAATASAAFLVSDRA